ncbi:hypothetical protein ACFXJ5_21440 [Streptomyces sp. NPDC059373]
MHRKRPASSGGGTSGAHAEALPRTRKLNAKYAAIAGLLVVTTAGAPPRLAHSIGLTTQAEGAHPAPGTPKGSANQADGGSPLFPTQVPPTPAPQQPMAEPKNGSGPDDATPVLFTTASGIGSGIPQAVLAAYQRAVAALAKSEPGCHLPVTLLGGIGKVESNHAEGGAVDSTGTTLRPILGPRLDGKNGFAAIPNTYGTKWGQSGAWARAVGPMQFIPSSWARWGGGGDPSNVNDAALAAGRYLCADGRDLSRPAGLKSAIESYNHSDQYLLTVLEWMEVYSGGIAAVPDGDLPGPQTAADDTSNGPGAGQPGASSGKKSGSPKPTTTPTPKPTGGTGKSGSPKPSPSPGSPTPSPSPTSPDSSDGGTVPALTNTVGSVTQVVGGLLSGVGGLLPSS